MKYFTALLLFVFGFYIENSWEMAPRCPTVKLPNGRVRGRAKGRIVRFSCFEGYTLVGNKYSTCIRGKWATPTPVCVNTHCPTLAKPKHALVADKYNGAVLIYFCEPGYKLIGAAEIYCNGREWNSTAPYCRDTNTATPIKCDFEEPDLCWWEQDPSHDFDWRRHNFETPSAHIGTGPTHDHTLGSGNDGYYLYIEASSRSINDTARIISPLYNASLTDTGCFSFWYHMYGASIGALHVYFKPETEITPRLMFSKEGNQGNQWLRGIFNLTKVDSNFQIIIEGVRGTTYVSDIAVDDVAILQGIECIAKNDTVSVNATDDDQIEIFNAQQSCRGKCSNSLSSDVSSVSTFPSLREPCQCTMDCAENSTCCPDFAEYCVLDASSVLDEVTEMTVASVVVNVNVIVTTESSGSKNESEKRDPSNSPNRNVIPTNPKDDIDPWPKPSEKLTSTTGAELIPKELPRAFTSSKPVLESSKLPLPVSPVVSNLSTITKTTSRNDKFRDQTDPHVLSMENAQQLNRDTTTLGLPGIVGIVIGILAGVAITTVVALVILRKRKSYKRGTNGSALSEDSDVRFLTSDEILDFNLARPSDYDEL